MDLNKLSGREYGGERADTTEDTREGFNCTIAYRAGFIWELSLETYMEL